VTVCGGLAVLQACTLGQFYPFSADRGAALRFGNQYGEYAYPLEGLVCSSSIVTGYADDVVMGEAGDTTIAYNYYFEH
jgi:hypothetical protein